MLTASMVTDRCRPIVSDVAPADVQFIVHQQQFDPAKNAEGANFNESPATFVAYAI